MSEILNKPYRLGAQALIVNKAGEILLVQLNDYQDHEWNIPGGGRESDETPQQNILRELEEEIGVTENDISILGRSDSMNIYVFPPELQNDGTEFTKKYRGQKKDQFLIMFESETRELTIDKNELNKYKWVKHNELKDHLVFEGQLANVLELLTEYERLNS